MFYDISSSLENASCLTTGRQAPRYTYQQTWYARCLRKNMQTRASANFKEHFHGL